MARDKSAKERIMNLFIFEDRGVEWLEPLTLTRTAFDLRCGATTLLERHLRNFGVSEALALVRHWSVIRIGGRTPPELAEWRISTKEFRENLEWAIDVPDGEHSPAVRQLLDELRAQGVVVLNAARDAW